MDSDSIRIMAVAATIVLGAATPAFAMGTIAKQGLDSIGRNPETEGAVRTTMILGLAFVESLAIFSLVIALIIRFVQ